MAIGSDARQGSGFPRTITRTITCPGHRWPGRLARGELRRALGLLLAVTAALAWTPRPSPASQLLAIGACAVDVSLSGATVAEPRTPTAAMFSNPAGLTVFDEKTIDVSTALSFADTEVDASEPPAYEDDNAFVILSPGAGLVVPGHGALRYGFATYGSVGTKFDFDADPRAGVPHGFFSEAAILTFASGLAYRVSDRLSVGAALTPLFGLLRMRFTPAGLPVRFTLRGPGLQGMFGLRWEPRRGLAVGLGVRTPGRVWMDGSNPAPGGRQDVDLELEMPAQIFAGASKHLGRRLKVATALRWSDASSFGNSPIEFAETPAASFPFVPAARDEWLGSIGVEYLWTDWLALRLGGSYANSIVGSRGVSPLLFDSDDYRLAAGFGLHFDHWTLDVMAGHAFEGTRSIPAGEAAMFPGRYTVSGQIAMIGFTWHPHKRPSPPAGTGASPGSPPPRIIHGLPSRERREPWRSAALGPQADAGMVQHDVEEAGGRRSRS